MALGIIEKAAALSAKGHKEQMRKHDNVPYVVHPFMVSRMLTKYDFREEVIAAGLVHDLLEDTDIKEEEIKNELGEEVLSIVKGLSEEKTSAWEERKKKYIELVRKGTDEIKAISCADKVHNMTNMLYMYSKKGDSLWDDFNRSYEKKLWFEQSMLKMFDEEGFKHPLVEEYRNLVKQFESL